MTTTNDYKKSRKELQVILRALKGWINRNYGKRCGERAKRCPTCLSWAIYDLLESFLD